MNRSRPGHWRSSTTLPIWVMANSTRVLLVDADPALAELLEEWLAEHGCRVVEDRPDLVLVDLPFPRERGLARLKQLGDAYPDTPVVAMPKPLIRDAFAAALRRAMNEVY
jgi:CheY-like chemotaxis protein